MANHICLKFRTVVDTENYELVGRIIKNASRVVSFRTRQQSRLCTFSWEAVTITAGMLNKDTLLGTGLTFSYLEVIPAYYFLFSQQWRRDSRDQVGSWEKGTAERAKGRQNWILLLRLEESADVRRTCHSHE